MKKLSAISHSLSPLARAALLLCLMPPALASELRAAAPVGGESESLPAGVAASDWSGIRTAYEEVRHAVVATEAGHRARNPGQRFETRFDERGFLVEAQDGGWSFGLELLRYGWGEFERCADRVRSVEIAGGRYERAWDDVLREWYVNDARGLEHGFTLRERPADVPEGAELRLELALRGNLEPLIDLGGRDVLLVDSQGRTSSTYAGLVVFDAEGSRFDARFERSERGLALRVADAGARYPLTIDPVVQQAYLKASNSGAGDLFGYSIALHGDTIVAGAPQEDSSATGVNGDGSSNGAPDAGAAYVFVRTESGWQFQAYLKASNTGAGDRFGESVAIHGDTIVVGASMEDSGSPGVNGDQSDNSRIDAGAAYVFTRSGTSWSQQAYLKASNPSGATPKWTEGYQFGHAVAIFGDTVVVGSPLEDSNATGIDGDPFTRGAFNSGAAYVFVRSGASWTQQAYFKASNAQANDHFGCSVAIHGESVAIGAMIESSSATGVDGDQDDNSAGASGAVYVFSRSDTTWSQQAYIKASNTGSQDLFGWSVAISADTLVVGAWGERSNATGVDGDQHNDSAPTSGAAYVFTRSGTTWTQQAYLKASNTQANDLFGYAVAVSGDLVLVGAPGEDSNARGVNGEQSDNSALTSGAGYLFLRESSSWTQLAYLKSSNSDAFDGFGRSVAMHADLAVVGASGEDSNATGVNGNQSNNSLESAGAAYVFDLAPPGTIRALCFGDGSGTPCPCDNPGLPGRGCASSAGPGAKLEASGSASVAAGTLSLHASGLVPLRAGLYFQGDLALADGRGLPFGDGLRCAGEAVIRLELRSADALGHSSTNTSIPTAGHVQPGDSRIYQLLYRDPLASPCQARFNTTSALRIVWAP